jgi:hypothetical protein
MGCGPSRRENKEVIDMGFIDIPLISNPNPRVEVEPSPPSFLNIDVHRELGRSTVASSQSSAQMIEHTDLSVHAAPDIEPSRQQSFAEHFSHIDANTFQTMPLLSMPHLQMGSFDSQPSHAIDDYCRFIDQVLTTLIVPLTTLEIVDHRPLTIALA